MGGPRINFNPETGIPSLEGNVILITVTSSAGHKHFPPGIVFDSLKSTAEDIEPIMKYCQRKMANVLHAQALAKHYHQFTTISIYPGAVFTDLYMKMDQSFQALARSRSVSIEEGVTNTLWAATAPDVVSGEYYEPVGVAGQISELANDKEFVKRLWDFTERELEG